MIKPRLFEIVFPRSISLSRNDKLLSQITIVLSMDQTCLFKPW